MGQRKPEGRQTDPAMVVILFFAISIFLGRVVFFVDYWMSQQIIRADDVFLPMIALTLF